MERPIAGAYGFLDRGDQALPKRREMTSWTMRPTKNKAASPAIMPYTSCDWSFSWCNRTDLTSLPRKVCSNVCTKPVPTKASMDAKVKKAPPKEVATAITTRFCQAIKTAPSKAQPAMMPISAARGRSTSRWIKSERMNKARPEPAKPPNRARPTLASATARVPNKIYHRS